MDTWETVALPILRWVSLNENKYNAFIGEMTEALNLTPSAVVRELDRLVDGDYLIGEKVRRNPSGPILSWYLMPLRLSERGARSVGMWPSGDPGDVLLERLRAVVQASPEGAQRAKARRVLEAMTDAGKTFATELAVSVVKGSAGLL